MTNNDHQLQIISSSPNILMELLLLRYLYEKKKEGFVSSEVWKPLLFSTLYTIVSMVLMVVAVSASWKCNTVNSQPIFLKIIYAIFSAMFSFIYLCLRALRVFPSCRGVSLL